MPLEKVTSIPLDYELPKTVAAVRDGIQSITSSGAVVSGLLAASAAQLLSIFKGDPPASEAVIGLCYAAIFLNISATIGSFVITDSLSELTYRASLQAKTVDACVFDGTQSRMMRSFGISNAWDIMLWHWLLTFYSGIITLILAVAVFVWQRETRGIAIAMTVIISVVVAPAVSFIFLGIRGERPAR